MAKSLLLIENKLPKTNANLPLNKDGRKLTTNCLIKAGLISRHIHYSHEHNALLCLSCAMSRKAVTSKNPARG